MGIAYVKSGDYLVPDLKIEKPSETFGKYGMLHRTYLKEHKNETYQSLLLQGNLTSYLADIDKTAREQVEQIVKDMLNLTSAPDKATKQLEWV